MDDQRVIADKGGEIRGDLFELWLSTEKIIRKPRDLHSFRRHRVARVEIDVERIVRGDMIDQLNAADFYDPVPRRRIKASGLGIERDLAHVASPALF